MTYWPAWAGGQAEAIKNFKLLIEQQELRNPKPVYAATYLLLGNVYAQQGKSTKAEEIWKHGHKLFPDDPSLAAKLRSCPDRTASCWAFVALSGPPDRKAGREWG